MLRLFDDEVFDRKPSTDVKIIPKGGISKKPSPHGKIILNRGYLLKYKFMRVALDRTHKSPTARVFLNRDICRDIFNIWNVLIIDDIYLYRLERT